MRQYTTQQQTNKLISLGLTPTYKRERKTIHDKAAPLYRFSIGELMATLPPILPIGEGAYLYITHDSVSWVVSYRHHSNTSREIYVTMEIELVDALYRMIVGLKQAKEV